MDVLWLKSGTTAQDDGLVPYDPNHGETTLAFVYWDTVGGGLLLVGPCASSHAHSHLCQYALRADDGANEHRVPVQKADVVGIGHDGRVTQWGNGAKSASDELKSRIEEVLFPHHPSNYWDPHDCCSH
ncbi:hypothetical protein KC727_01970 [Candidatus Kaiserbacteria bacterium]|nr:hypothetical protein [Candidatus Kaiserbacteria bacterium]